MVMALYVSAEQQLFLRHAASHKHKGVQLRIYIGALQSTSSLILSNYSAKRQLRKILKWKGSMTKSGIITLIEAANADKLLSLP